jgi:branched-subunit amino acid ABC-type transport system permease component
VYSNHEKQLIGLILGSALVLAANRLANTFGLNGVINNAHREHKIAKAAIQLPHQ